MTSPDARDDRPRRTTAEWWTFAAALALVGLVAGIIVATWVTGASGPPLIEAERSGPIVREGAAHRVPFEVRNEGGAAVESVQVVATLTIDGRVEGEGEQIFLFLSGGERERGDFLFARDPALGELTIEVVSYSRP